jgi:hypothetical protein
MFRPSLKNIVLDFIWEIFLIAAFVYAGTFVYRLAQPKGIINWIAVWLMISIVPLIENILNFINSNIKIRGLLPGKWVKNPPVG